MPSIKKRVTGFIRQLSAPTGVQTSSAVDKNDSPKANTRNGKPLKTTQSSSVTPNNSEPNLGFIQNYLNKGISHSPGEAILSGKTGHDLPVMQLDELNEDVFAAYTGPEGGITSISKVEDGGIVTLPDAAEDSEDFDYIDLDGLGGYSRRSSNNDVIEEKVDEQQIGSKRESLLQEAVMNMNDKENKESNVDPRRRRELSIENDYPELGGDFPLCAALSSNNNNNDDMLKSKNHFITPNHLVSRKLKLDLRNDCETLIAGIQHWNRPNNAATGQAVTLYERHPHTAEHAGNPIADTFATVARKNSAILVLGDGVNWGTRAALASRCAVHGAVEHLNSAIFGGGGGGKPKVLTTQEVFQCLLRSFHAAHSLILQEEAQLTTLTACVVLPVKNEDCEAGNSKSKFVACVCNVGDSLAYVYSPNNGHVREITQGSHDIQSNRDMRDALGALGPVDGINPELSNLTCSLTEVQPGDIVFLTSDGVSDNFDPVVGKFCVPSRSDAGRQKHSSLPSVEAFQRHELTLMRMEDILNHGSGAGGSSNYPSLTGVRSTSMVPTNNSPYATGRVASAAELCHRMIDFCQRLTTAKRKILEDPELYGEHTRHALPDSDAMRLDQKMRRRKVCEKLALVPGKLDHATIVAYSVEDRRQSLRNFVATAKIKEESPTTNGTILRAPCASTEDLTFRESPEAEEEEDGEKQNRKQQNQDPTPTPSISLSSGASSNNNLCGSLSVTPVHRTQQDIDLCFNETRTTGSTSTQK